MPPIAIRLAIALALILGAVSAHSQFDYLPRANPIGGAPQPRSSGTGAGSGVESSFCTIYCPSYVSTGGLSGQRTGEDGYVARSWGPAGPLNTGFYAASDYTGQSLSTSCPSKLSSNTTYRWCEWKAGVIVENADNVLIHGCIVHGASNQFFIALFNNSNVTIEFCELRPPLAVHFQAAVPGGDMITSQFGLLQNIGTGTIVMNHDEIWGCGNAVTMTSGAITLNYVWIHDPRDPAPSGDHTDGYLDNQLSGKSPPMLTISHSTISAVGNTNAVGQQGQPGGYSHTSITQSYFSGFSWTVNLCGKGAGCTADRANVFTDNQFGDDFHALYGNLYGGIYAHFLWRRNTWRNTPGGYDSMNSALHNGKFVLPDGTWAAADFSGT